MYKFNDREITFDKYNTPTPWMNYLSNGTFHTMISQAGGGVAFYKPSRIIIVLRMISGQTVFSIYQPTEADFIHISRIMTIFGVRQTNRASQSLISGVPHTVWDIQDLKLKRMDLK